LPHGVSTQRYHLEDYIVPYLFKLDHFKANYIGEIRKITDWICHKYDKARPSVIFRNFPLLEQEPTRDQDASGLFTTEVPPTGKIEGDIQPLVKFKAII